MTTPLISSYRHYLNCSFEDTDTGQFPVHHLPSEVNSSPAHWWGVGTFKQSQKRTTLDRFCERLRNSNHTGSEFGIEYLHEKYRNNLATATISSAGGVILSFFSFLNESGTNILQISRQSIGNYVERDLDKGLKAGAIKTKLRVLYAFIRFLVDKKVLPSELLYKKVTIQPEELLPKAIPTHDIKSILSEIISVRDRALILLLLRTGVRIGELLNVTISDIHLSERKILLYLGEKNYQGRVVYYSEDAEKALLHWLEVRDPGRRNLFYGRSSHAMSYVNAWNIMRKAIKSSGLSNKGYSLHSLRHTFATDMLNAGLRLEVLQQLLGHRSIEITRRYARMSDVTRENEYFTAMTVIENGESNESYRVNSELQEVFEKKKLVRSYSKKLSS